MVANDGYHFFMRIKNEALQTENLKTHVGLYLFKSSTTPLDTHYTLGASFH